MKQILVLIICFLDVAFLTFGSAKEKVSSYPSTGQMQNQNSSNLTSSSEVERNKKIQRLFYRTGSVESNCLRNLRNQFFYRNRSGLRRSFGMIKPLRMPEFRNDGSNYQIPFFYKMRQNTLHEHQNTRRPFGNDKIIFLPPYVKFNKKKVNIFHNTNEFKINQTPQPNSHESMKNQKQKNVTNEARQEILIEENPKLLEESIKPLKTFTSDGEGRETEKQYPIENSTVFEKERDFSITVDISSSETSETSQKLNKIKLETDTYLKTSPQLFWYQKNLTQTQPYEVEEIIEGDLDNKEVDNIKNIPFNEPVLLAKEIKKITNSKNGQKVNGIQSMMGSSINTVIKTLMSPVIKVFPTVENNQETFSKDKVQNHLVPYGYLTSTLPRLTSSGQRPPNIYRIMNSSRPFSNRHEQGKNLKIKKFQIKDRFQNRTPQTTESTEEPKKIIPESNSDSKVNILSSLNTEYSKNVYATGTTEILYTSSGVPDTEENTVNMKKNLLQKTTPDIESTSLSSLAPKFKTPETQEIVESSTTHKALSVKTENPLIISSKTQTTFSKISSSQEVTTATFIQSTNLFEEFIENSTDSNTSPNMQLFETDEHLSEIALNETNLTISDFPDFTVHPTALYDSITTIKSDFNKNQNTIGKDGRKIHFPYEFDKTTKSSVITGYENTGPRRSDILITENFNDYEEIDNNLSTLNYLDKLKEKNFFSPRNSFSHSKFESILPLIPIVVNDLRDGRISPEDISILSEAFGKHWPSIMILTNVTNLDMLPLLKMKNEEDWNNIWQSFLPKSIKNTELTTVKMTETNSKQESDDYLPYDYLSEYEDFYKYVFESEKEKEKKRKKPRLKRGEENNLKNITASEEYFENSQEKGSTTINMQLRRFVSYPNVGRRKSARGTTTIKTG